MGVDDRPDERRCGRPGCDSVGTHVVIDAKTGEKLCEVWPRPGDFSKEAMSILMDLLVEGYERIQGIDPKSQDRADSLDTDDDPD